MSRTFKQWTPATAELELLHECWLARLPPARIAVMSQFEFQLSTLCGSSTGADPRRTFKEGHRSDFFGRRKGGARWLKSNLG